MIFGILLIILGAVAGFCIGYQMFSDIVNPLLFIPFIFYLFLFCYDGYLYLYEMLGINLPQIKIDFVLKVISIVTFVFFFIMGAKKSFHVPPALERMWM